MQSPVCLRGSVDGGRHALDQVWRRICDALQHRDPSHRVSRERVPSDHLTDGPGIRVGGMAYGTDVFRLADLTTSRSVSHKRFAISRDTTFEVDRLFLLIMA